MSESILSSNKSESDESESDESLSEDDIQEHDNNLQLEGKILDKYNIISELGRGAYSIVWLGYNIEKNEYNAIKVQNPKEYKCGLQENNFMKKLPNNLDFFNHLKKEFVFSKNNSKFLCSVYELHSGNLDGFLRKGHFTTGYSCKMAINILKQLLLSVNYLHKNLKVFHSDIKTDNILLKGINNKDNNIICAYNKLNFLDEYIKKQKEYCIANKKNLSKLNSSTKLIIREQVHANFVSLLKKDNNNNNNLKYELDDIYINQCKISLADFGSFVERGEYYDESYGTRYYRSPENILVGKLTCGNDVWAIGCTFYELLTGNILFKPDKDKIYDRDHYHLKLINELCGVYPIEFLNSTKHWKKYFDKNYKLKLNKNLNFNNKLDELKKIPDKNIENIIILLKKMFEIDQKKRFNCQQCLDFIHRNITIEN